MTKEKYENAVVAEVKLRLKEEEWYRGVCVDTINVSFEAGKSVTEAADTAETDTIAWDFPGGLVTFLMRST